MDAVTHASVLLNSSELLKAAVAKQHNKQSKRIMALHIGSDLHPKKRYNRDVYKHDKVQPDSMLFKTLCEVVAAVVRRRQKC